MMKHETKKGAEGNLTLHYGRKQPHLRREDCIAVEVSQTTKNCVRERLLKQVHSIMRLGFCNQTVIFTIFSNIVTDLGNGVPFSRPPPLGVQGLRCSQCTFFSGSKCSSSCRSISPINVRNFLYACYAATSINPINKKIDEIIIEINLVVTALPFMFRSRKHIHSCQQITFVMVHDHSVNIKCITSSDPTKPRVQPKFMSSGGQTHKIIHNCCHIFE